MKYLQRIRADDLDRLFSGGAPPAHSELDDLAQLVQKVQSSYSIDVDPDVRAAHLAALMRTVNLTDKRDLAARPASTIGGMLGSPSAFSKRTRFALESVLATATTKLALGGVAVALAATGGLAGTGNLPDPAQTAVSRAVDNVGIEIPLGAGAEAAANALRIAEEAAVAAAGKAQAAGRAAVEPLGAAGGDQPWSDNSRFGRGVAADATDGAVQGGVSNAARAQAEERKTEGQSHRPEGTEPPGGTGPPAGAGPPGGTGPPVSGGVPAGGGVPGNAGPPAGGAGSRAAGSAGQVVPGTDDPGAGNITASDSAGRPSSVGGGRP